MATRVVKIDVQRAVEAKLRKICEQEFRNASDQINYMIHHIYGEAATTDSTEIVSTTSAPLVLKDENTAIFHVLLAACLCKKARIPITKSNVKSRLTGGYKGLSNDKVGSGLSNLLRYDYLERDAECNGNATYKLTQVDWERALSQDRRRKLMDIPYFQRHIRPQGP